MAKRYEHYSQAFLSWLDDNSIKYVCADTRTKQKFTNAKIKSFDFLIYPPKAQSCIIFLNGRKYNGQSLETFGQLQSWVMADDIGHLEKWSQIFAQAHQPVFVFAYELKNIEVDSDGWEIFEFNNKRYVFAAVKLDDYKKGAVVRSKKWQTVHLPSEYFKSCAFDLKNL